MLRKQHKRYQEHYILDIVVTIWAILITSLCIFVALCIFIWYHCFGEWKFQNQGRLVRNPDSTHGQRIAVQNARIPGICGFVQTGCRSYAVSSIRLVYSAAALGMSVVIFLHGCCQVVSVVKERMKR